MKRPNKEYIVNNNLHQQVADQLFDLFKKCQVFIEENRKKVVDFIKKEIEMGNENDGGFELTKRMEKDIDVEPRGDVVEILDRLSIDLHRKIEEETKKWVKRNSIQPKLEKNQQVFVQQKGQGYIAYIDYDHAKYCVSIPSKGHKGLNNPQQPGTIGTMIPFEKLEEKNKTFK